MAVVQQEAPVAALTTKMEIPVGLLTEELEETQEVLEEVSMTMVKAMRGVFSTLPLGNQEHPSTQEMVVLAAPTEILVVVSTRELGGAVAALTQAELPVEDLEEASMGMVVPRQADKAGVSMEAALEVVKAGVSIEEAHLYPQLADSSALVGLMVELQTAKARASMMMEGKA